MRSKVSNVSAAILAGGKNSRMPGVNKAFIQIGATAIIQKTIGVLKTIFEEIIVITNSPRDFSSYERDVTIAQDIIKDAGPLGGMHAALSVTSKEAVFFVACDMPFLHNALIKKQLGLFRGIDCDAFVPRMGKLIEPLHAVYKKRLEKSIYDFLQGGSDHSIKSFLGAVNTRYWDFKDNASNRRIFTNINTGEDLENLILGNKNKRHFSTGLQVKSKVWLEKNGELVFGSGKAVILRAILETGSINKAARELKMSYRHAWSYIKSAEKRLGQPLVICLKGGVNGGSATLTPYAKTLLEKFAALNDRSNAFVDEIYKEIF